MASEYDALLAESPKSQYDALLNQGSQYDALLKDEKPSPVEEIKPAPTITGEISAGRIGNAASLLKEKVEGVLAPTQPASALQVHGEGGRSLLGTSEQIPSDPKDSALAAAGKAIVNVGNRTMAGLTSPEMLPLLPVAGAEATIGKILGGAFAVQSATEVPGEVKKAFNAPDTQGKVEGGLGALLSTLFTVAGGAHATGIAELLPKAAPKVSETTNEPITAPETPAAAPTDGLAGASAGEAASPTEPPVVAEPAGSGVDVAARETPEQILARQKLEEDSLAQQFFDKPYSELTDSELAQLHEMRQGEPDSGLPAETPAASEPSAEAETTTAEPAETEQAVSSGDSTGISQRVHDERAAEGKIGQVLPGEGVSAEEMVDRGRTLISEGTDPEAVSQRIKETKQVSSDDISVLRAHMETLSRATNAAEDALRKAPSDPAAKAAYDAAWRAETDWAQNAVKPAQTEWHKSGMAMQGETDIDTGTFSGLRRAFRDEKGRDPNATEQTKLQKVADKTKETDKSVEKAKAAYDEVIKNESAKNKLSTKVEDLRAHFADRLREMLPCEI